MGKQGINAVKTPAGLVPNPMLAVSSRLARVQFNESIPWLLLLSVRILRNGRQTGHKLE
jgi:hypothetical protein